MLDAIFPETGNMKLNHRSDPAIGRFLARRNAIENLRDARFAVAHDRAACVAGHSMTTMVEPLAISGSDQHLSVDAAKSFCVGVIDQLGSKRIRLVHGIPFRPQSLPSCSVADDETTSVCRYLGPHE
jgi:hypothetical protein